MVYELKFADIGEGVHEGEILEWHVAIGDVVKVEQLLLEVNTEKVNAEITSPVSGTVDSLEFDVGDIVKVGQVLIKIDEGNGKSAETKKPQPKKDVEAEKDDSLFTPASPFKRITQITKASKVVNERVLAPPAVRRRAREANVDLKTVVGSGPGGRISQSDLEAHLGRDSLIPPIERERKKLEIIPGGETRIPLKGTRRTIALSMRKSKDTAAHYTYMDEVDISALESLRNELKPLMEEKGIKISYPALIMKCMVPALKKYPLLNSMLDEEKQEIVIKDYFNIGLSVETDEGLVVPVVKNVEQKSIWHISEDITGIAERARNGKMSMDDITGGTITITSIGNIGGVMATPIIKPPEVAILGIFKAKLKPVVIEKNGGAQIEIRKMMFLCLSLDHRIVDGAVGARFMNELIRYIQNPALVWMEEENQY